MAWRGPAEDEPPSAPIYVRLGMTKGALIAFTIIVLAVIAGFVQLERLTADQKHTLNKVRVQQAQTLHALREVCRQGQVIYGLTQPVLKLFEFDIAHGTVPKQALPVYADALRVFQGYATILRERPACEELANP